MKCEYSQSPTVASAGMEKLALAAGIPTCLKMLLPEQQFLFSDSPEKMEQIRSRHPLLTNSQQNLKAQIKAFYF